MRQAGRTSSCTNSESVSLFPIADEAGAMLGNIMEGRRTISANCLLPQMRASRAALCVQCGVRYSRK